MSIEEKVISVKALLFPDSLLFMNIYSACLYAIKDIEVKKIIIKNEYFSGTYFNAFTR